MKEHAEDADDTPRNEIAFQSAGAIVEVANDGILMIGRSTAAPSGALMQTFRHRELAEHHVALVAGEQKWFAVAVGGDAFVDGRNIRAAELRVGSVLQCGPLAWRHAGAGKLRPVQPIPGVTLQVDAEVEGRLMRTGLTIRQGEMTAIVGPSGCGKSTLLETIRDGSGLVCEPPAGSLFFVPQRDLVHGDLSLRDALAAIGRLYGREVKPIDIEAALDAVDLPADFQSKFPRELSGGQLRRFRIAGALLSGAGVIVLDEPDSGLDHETATSVIRLLRSLAVRGATIVAVTHHRHVLEDFDRVIEMKPTEQGGALRSNNETSSRVDAVATENDSSESVTSETTSEHMLPRWLRQFGILVTRERRKLTSPRIQRVSFGAFGLPNLLVGWGLVPLLFAVAVAISVPTDPDRNLADGLYGEMAPMARLGFLAVVSVIWMSASQSHLSVTRDRELCDYEMSYGLTWAQLISAKAAVFCLAGMLQTTVFAVLLYLIRHLWLERSFFVDEHWWQLPGVWLCLLIVSLTATTVGLLISAVAGRAPLLATAMLPVVMMFQILFSVPFAVSNPDGYEPLADYDRLTVFEQSEGEGSGDDWEDGDWEDDGWDDLDAERPMYWTSLISYATLSRYGDQWIRSFALTTEPVEQGRAVQWSCIGGLFAIGVMSLMASWGVLCLQTSRLGIRRGVVLRAAVVILLGVLTSPSASAQDDGVVSDAMIRLPLVEGRYDESELRRFFGGGEAEPRWRELGNQDRIGLVALELVGKIEFDLGNDELTIRMKGAPKWELMRCLAPPRLLGAEELGSDEAVLFVHGLEGGRSTFARARRRCEELGVDTLTFEYPNDGPPAEVGRQLATLLAELKRREPRLRLHVLAHSLGGLIVTWAVGEPDFPARAVPNVFTFGTPFRGSRLAEFHDELELYDVAYRLATFTPGGLDTVHDGRGEAAVALRPGSEFLADLASRPRPSGVRFHISAGTKSFLSEERRTLLLGGLPGEMKRLGVSPEYASRLERLLQTRELTDGAGDGAVTRESALGLAGAATSTTFPLTHLALVTEDGPLEWALRGAGLLEVANQPAK
ncbi:MAG: ATP-binding cassette domain-containing protein [Planctomycetota bacterium]